MKSRLLRVSATSMLALMLFGALAFVLGFYASAHTPAVQASPEIEKSAAVPIMRRAISIPYGISSVFTVTEGGSRVAASGHGICWDEGQMFDLQVRIAQSSTNAFAVGRSIDVCAGGEQQTWDADAPAQSSATFELGNARACAEVTEFGQHGTAEEHQWCKDVTLVAENSTY